MVGGVVVVYVHVMTTPILIQQETVRCGEATLEYMYLHHGTVHLYCSTTLPFINPGCSPRYHHGGNITPSMLFPSYPGHTSHEPCTGEGAKAPWRRTTSQMSRSSPAHGYLSSKSSLTPLHTQLPPKSS